MNGNEVQEEVAAILRNLNFCVSPIPTTSVRRADYLVEDDQNTYIVEVRTKTDDGRHEAEISEFGEALSTYVIARNSTLSGIVRDKDDQLSKTPGPTKAFRVLWLVCVGHDTKTQIDQFIATLLGIVDIAVLDGNNTIAVPCYFFDFADFFACPNIDAVVLHDGRGLKMVPNPVGARFNELRATRLAKPFVSHNSFVDPLGRERDGNAYTANDFTGDRRDDTAVVEHIKRKYGLTYAVPLRWNRAVSTVAIQTPPR